MESFCDHAGQKGISSITGNATFDTQGFEDADGPGYGNIMGRTGPTGKQIIAHDYPATMSGHRDACGFSRSQDKNQFPESDHFGRCHC